MKSQKLIIGITSIVDGDAAVKLVDSVFVYMRINQGSKYTHPTFSKPLCLNNIFDDYACSIFSGIAGVQSSFTLESRNELEFPNYRGGDMYHAIIHGPDPNLEALTPGRTFGQIPNSGQGQLRPRFRAAALARQPEPCSSQRGSLQPRKYMDRCEG